MIAFEVKDMSCGHCVGTINRAVNAADPDANVQIDLATHRVDIEPGSGNMAQLSAAIRAAGYTPVLIESPEAVGEVVATRAGGGCRCR